MSQNSKLFPQLNSGSRRITPLPLPKGPTMAATTTAKPVTKAFQGATRPKNESGGKKIAPAWQGGPKGKPSKNC